MCLNPLQHSNVHGIYFCEPNMFCGSSFSPGGVFGYIDR
jgi:hypothetical protein